MLLDFKIWLYVPVGIVAYPRKISQNQFYQLFHVGKWRRTIAVPNVGTASIQDSPNRNPSVNNILTHSKQDAVEMIDQKVKLLAHKSDIGWLSLISVFFLAGQDY